MGLFFREVLNMDMSKDAVNMNNDEVNVTEELQYIYKDNCNLNHIWRSSWLNFWPWPDFLINFIFEVQLLQI